MSNNSRKRAYSVSSAYADGTPEEEPEKLINDKDIIKRLNPLDHVTAMNLLITAARSHLLVLPAVKAETSLIYEQGRSSTFDFDRFFVAEETSPIFPLITAETWSDGDDGSWSGRRSRMQLLRLIGGQCYFGVLMALVQLDMEESKDTIMLDLTAEMAFWKKAEC